MDERLYITSEQFDDLVDTEKLFYLWCDKCERFYNIRLLSQCHHVEKGSVLE